MWKVIGLLGIIAISFFVGVVTSAFLHIGSPIATVQLHNSAETAASVTLTHEHGSLKVERLEPGSSRNVRFYAPGESSYQLTISFTDGRTISVDSRYIEAGYSIRETITATSVNPKYDLLSYAEAPDPGRDVLLPLR